MKVLTVLRGCKRLFLIKLYLPGLKRNLNKISPLIREILGSGIVMDLSFHEDIIYFPVKKIVAICGYDNEIVDLAFYIREKFNACNIGCLEESRDEVVAKLQE